MRSRTPPSRRIFKEVRSPIKDGRQKERKAAEKEKVSFDYGKTKDKKSSKEKEKIRNFVF